MISMDERISLDSILKKVSHCIRKQHPYKKINTSNDIKYWKKKF